MSDDTTKEAADEVAGGSDAAEAVAAAPSMDGAMVTSVKSVAVVGASAKPGSLG